MKKIVKKIGNSVGVIYNSNEQTIYDIKEGDILNQSDMVNESSALRNNKASRRRVKTPKQCVESETKKGVTKKRD